MAILKKIGFPFLFIILFSFNSVYSQGLVKGFPQTNGAVYGMANRNDTVFVAGNFTSLYHPDSIISYGGLVNPNTGKPSSNWDQPNGAVYASAPDKKSGFFIGGDFSKVASLNAVRIAHIDSSGTLQNTFSNTGINGVVKSMATLGDTLFVGGQFNLVGSFLESAGGPVLKNSALVSSNFPSINGYVFCAIPDGVGGWYVTGSFTKVGNTTRNRAARIDANGNVLAWNPNLNGICYAMVRYQNTVFLGGQFTNVGTLVRSGIASVDTASGAVSTWAPGSPSTVVRSFSISNNILYLAGAFGTMASQTRQSLAAFNLPSLTLTSFSTTMSLTNGQATLFSVLALGNKVFVGGRFDNIGGSSRTCLAALNPSNGLVIPNWSANADDVVEQIKFLNGFIYVGGSFTTVKGLSRNYIAAADTSTGALNSLNPSINGFVTCIEIDPLDSTLYISGNFSNYFHSINLKNFTSLSWPLRTNAYANTISLFGSRLFVGGYFTSLGGFERTNLAAFNTKTGALLSWNPGTNGRVEAMCNVKDSFIWIGGYFTEVSSASRGRLACFDRFGSLNNYLFSFDNYVKAISFSGDSILYVGGNFFTCSTLSPFVSSSVVAHKIAAINFRTARIQPFWNPSSNNEVNSLLVDGNILYAGGTFSAIGGQPRALLAAISRSTALATSFDAGLSSSGSSVNSLLKYNNEIIVGGGFTYEINGRIIRKNLASFQVSNSALTSFVNDPDLSVFTLSMHLNKMYCGGEFKVLGGKARSNLGAFLSSNGAILDFNLGASNASGSQSVFNISWFDNNLFLGGTFTKIGDSSRQYFGVIDIQNQTVLPFYPSPNGIIYSTYVHQGYLYIAGQFTNIGGAARNRLAIFNYPSFTSTTINPNFSGWPLTYYPSSPSKILIGGGFTTIASVSAPNSAAFQLPSFTRIIGTPTVNSTVNKYLLNKNQLYVAGGFTLINGLSKPYFAQLDSSSYLPTSFSPSINGSVFTFDVSAAGNIYLGGGFTTIGGQARDKCGSISSTSGIPNSWYPVFFNPAPNTASVRQILCVGNMVIIGGIFSSLNGLPVSNLAVVYGFDTSVTINTVSGTGTVCKGNNLIVNYSVSNPYRAGNQFILELVDTLLPNKTPIVLSSQNSSVSGVFNINLPNNLPTNRAYYVQIRTTNPVSISKNWPNIINTISCVPNQGPTNLQFSNVTANSATLTWTRGNGQRCIVIAKQGSLVDSLPINGLEYTANSSFGMGALLGTGNYIVYNGTANSVNITNLLLSSNYHFAVIEFNGNNSTTAYLNSQVLYGNMVSLPVNWLSFVAKKINSNEVLLNWKTASEINNSHFEIQRKFEDDFDWKTIHVLKGRGTTNQTSTYSYNDYLDNLSADELVLFYRLKQVDYDGKFDFSKTIKILNDKNFDESIQIFPNPFDESFQFINKENSIISYRIYSVNGKKLKNGTLNGSQIETIDCADLEPGLYVLELDTLKDLIRQKIFKK